MKKAIATKPGEPTKYVEMTTKEKNKRKKDESAELEKQRLYGYKDKRRAEYDSWEDQIDVILKQFKSLKSQNIELIPECEELIQKRDLIKNKYKKPKK